MLSSVLNSAQAIAVNIEIMRTFLRLRETIESNKELALRLEELQSKAVWNLMLEFPPKKLHRNITQEWSASNTSGLPCCSLPCSWLERPCLRKSDQIDAALRHPTNSPCRNQWPA